MDEVRTIKPCFTLGRGRGCRGCIISNWHVGMSKDKMLKQLREEQGMWRREQLELDELKEKFLLGKVKFFPSLKAEREEECSSEMSDANKISRRKKICSCTFCNHLEKITSNEQKNINNVKQTDPGLKQHNHQTIVTPVRFDCCVCPKFGTNSLRLSEFQCKYCSIKTPNKSSSIHREPGLFGRHSNDLFDGWPLLSDGTPMFYH